MRDIEEYKYGASGLEALRACFQPHNNPGLILKEIHKNQKSQQRRPRRFLPCMRLLVAES